MCPTCWNPPQPPGLRAAVVFAAGFAETGAEGKARQARLEALSRERGFLICGPNCYGVLNVFGKAPLFASAIPSGFLAGPVALVSQSGGLSTTIANALMLNRHVGLSHIVSCGNQSGATFEEYFNYFVEDENTRVIAAFVEGFKQPEKLLAVARKAAAARQAADHSQRRKIRSFETRCGNAFRLLGRLGGSRRRRVSPGRHRFGAQSSMN